MPTYLEPLGLTQKAIADHLFERDERNGRAGKERAGAPEPHAVVQISGSPNDQGDGTLDPASPVAAILAALRGRSA